MIVLHLLVLHGHFKLGFDLRCARVDEGEALEDATLDLLAMARRVSHH